MQSNIALTSPTRPPPHVIYATCEPLALATRSARAKPRADDSATQARFVWTLAHELRQPLSVLSTALSLIGPDAPAETTKCATEIMGRQLRQMSRMVEDLVDMARLANGKVSLQSQRIDLRDVIVDAAADVAPALAKRGLVLDVECGSLPLWVHADSQRLHQVFANLLRNAISYTDPGGRIALCAEGGPVSVTARVLDTGRGIAAPALAHIFDLFAQELPSADGLGIGLSVVQEIVALHSGHISARSQGPGKGSEFIVTLPRLIEP